MRIIIIKRALNMELTPLISSFIILLREGFEAMLIAMLVLCI